MSEPVARRVAAAGVLLICCAVWTGLCTAVAGRPIEHTLPLVGLVLLAGAALALGAALARVRPWLPATVLALGVLSLVALAPAPFGGGPLGGPLGYANADAALYVQLSAVLLVTAAPLRGPFRGVLALLAAVPVLLTAALGDRAAAGTGVLLLIVGWLLLAAPGHRVRRTALAAAGAAVVAAALFAPMVAAAELRPPTVDSRRLALWHDGLDLVESAPAFGHGARTFPDTSPTARADADTRETHAEVLQVAAEGGLPAAGLLVGAELLLVAALAARGTGAAAVAAVGFAVLCLQAGIDYVLHFPAVVAAGALVVGAGLGVSHRAVTRRTPAPAGSAQVAAAPGSPG
ncbi:MAG: O-antigen ligase family protein [Motilibacteraceae bacterium]